MARKTFKKILALCYDEEGYDELHKELISIEAAAKKHKDYNQAIEEAFRAIPLYTEDFPEDTMEEIELIYEDYMYSLEE